MAVLPFPVQEVRQELSADNLSFTAALFATKSYMIQPRVAGFLTKINYSNGMPVERGQLLFAINKEEYIASAAEAKASLASAEASLKEAESNYKRSIPLVKAGAISESQYDSARAILASAVESVNSAKAALTLAELNLSYTDIISPADGVIAASDAQEGDYIGPGTNYTLLTTISMIDTMSADIQLPLSTYLKYRPQGTPSFKNDSLLSAIKLSVSGREYPIEGIYQYTKQNIDQSTGTIVLTVDFPNPGYTLKPGQYVDITTNIGELSPRIMVPASSVVQLQGNHYLYTVATDSVVSFVPVKMGRQSGMLWEVISGIESGEMVVLEGFHKLHKGMKIAPKMVEEK